jgi:hypothetical protein
MFLSLVRSRYPNVPNCAKCKIPNELLVACGSSSSIAYVSLEDAAIFYSLSRVYETNCIKLSVKKKTKRKWERKIEMSSVSKAGVEIIDFLMCLSFLLRVSSLSILTEVPPTFIFSSLTKNSFQSPLHFHHKISPS